MIVSLIRHVNYLYFNLHAEEVFTSNYIKDNNDGVFVSSLQFETIDRLYIFIKDSKLNDYRYVILDFKNILHTQANLINKVLDIRKLGYKLIFKNLSKNIFAQLSLNLIENENNHLNSKEDYDIFYFFNNDSDNIDEGSINENEIFNQEFEKRIKEYVVRYNEKHASSFVYLRSFIDLKKFISNERPFIYFALYKLAMKIKSKWKDEILTEPTLVSQSLTSTFIVSILSKLLKLDILVFDKVGPITKLYKKLENHTFNNKKYIIVSDLVCLGTEVKITKSLIEFSGGQYLGNVSIIKIETLTRDDLQLKNIDRTISIFSVTQQNNEDLDYDIYTNLTPLPKNE